MLNKLTNRVDILTPNTQQDSTGGVLPPQVWHAGVWAAVEDLAGRELAAAQQFGSDLTVKITVRHANITARCQVRFGDKVYTIAYVRDASGSPVSTFQGSIAGRSAPLRNMYQELFCTLTNDGAIAPVTGQGEPLGTVDDVDGGSFD